MIEVRGRLPVGEGEVDREPPPKPPSRLARQLALAWLVDELVERGELRSYADAARRLGICRTRISQVARLRFLAPDIQRQILAGKVDLTERRLRPVTAVLDWGEQGRRFEGVTVGSRLSRYFKRHQRSLVRIAQRVQRRHSELGLRRRELKKLVEITLELQEEKQRERDAFAITPEIADIIRGFQPGERFSERHYAPDS